MPSFVRSQLLRVLLLFVALAPRVSFAASPDDERIPPELLREDLKTMEDAIVRTHPQLNHSVDPNAMARAFENVRAALVRPMDRDEAWRVFATLNPVLADGHLFVGYADWRGETRAHLARGGMLFPFEVQVETGGRLLVRAALGGAPTQSAGVRIMRINSVDAGQVVATLLARVHGDSPAFRASLLSRRFWFYYWKVFGAPDAFALRLERAAVTVAASPATPQVLADEATFERTYGLELRPGKVAVLKLGAFSWEDDAAFFQFTAHAFRRIRETGMETLVIDLRDNGGGDDRYWKEGVLAYLADKPYVWGSAYRKRVLERYRDEGEVVGQLVVGRLDTPVEPSANRGEVFHGRTYVLVGPATYSSAVLFANVAQDYGFARLAGTDRAVRSRQSGGVERYPLEHTGLTVWVPRFVLERPRPIEGDVWLRPDIVLRDVRSLASDPIDALIAGDAED